MMCHALNSAPTQRQLVGRYEEEKNGYHAPISKTTRGARGTRKVLQMVLFFPLTKEIGYAFAYTNI